MKLTTEQLAALAGVKADTIRAAYCRRGEYYGLRPEKCLNGRLLWPADSQQRLFATSAKKAA